MLPTPIPDELIRPGTVRRVFTAPNGDMLDDSIRPCEALISRDPGTDLAAVQVRLVLEDGELERLAAGGTVWLTMIGGLAPFDVRVEES